MRNTVIDLTVENDEDSDNDVNDENNDEDGDNDVDDENDDEDGDDVDDENDDEDGDNDVDDENGDETVRTSSRVANSRGLVRDKTDKVFCFRFCQHILFAFTTMTNKYCRVAVSRMAS